MKNKNLKIKKGFTLIETLVAITVLSLAIVGPITLSANGVSTASISRDKLTAFYLGQEAIEYVRNVRDTNLINKSSDWLAGLDSVSNNCTGTNGCYIDAMKNVADTDAVIPCLPPPSGCPKLKFNGTNYNYASGDDTIFTRTVKITTNNNNGDEAQVDVIVSWTGKYGTKTINLRDIIFNLKT